MYPSWEKPGLRVLAASPQLLVPMIFLATLRPMPDTTIEDMEMAFRIAAAAGIRTGRQLERLVRPYVERKQGGRDDSDRIVEGQLSRFELGLDRFGLGPSLRFPPRSLADVADLVRGNPDWFNFALYHFEQAFYLEHDKASQQAMLHPAPTPLDVARTDAWIGAIGEHMAQRWELMVHSWTQQGAFMGNTAPDFSSKDQTARDIEIVEAPPAFPPAAAVHVGGAA